MESKILGMSAERFNERYPVGTAVRFYPTTNPSSYVETKTRSEAWLLGHGAVVVLIDGRSGGVLLSHLTVIA